MVASSKSDRSGFWRRKGGRIWYTNDPVTGRDVSTRYRDIEAARRWRAARERIAADPAVAASALATIGDECRMMLDALALLGRPTKYYEQKLGHWVRILGNDCALAEVGPAAFDQFIGQRRSEGVTNHTISKELKCMITTLRQAKRFGRYAGSLDTLRPLGFSAEYEPRTRVLTVREVAALMAALPPEARAFVALVVALGLRLGEALALTPADVDLVAWVVRVPGTKTKAARRDVPVLEPFRWLVAEAATHLPFGPFLRSKHYTERFDVACRRAGIERCTPNDLRRTHATLLRNSGVDGETARALLGHTKGSQLLEQVYDKPRPAELAARAGALPALAADAAGWTKTLQSLALTPDFTEENPASGRPWGPSHSAVGRLPPIESRGYESGAAQSEPAVTARALQSPTVELPAREALALAADAVLTRRTGTLTGAVIRRRVKDVG